MRIVNCCTYEGCAGTERAFIDYTRAFRAGGHQVTALVHEEAPFIGEIASLGVDIVTTEFDQDYRASDKEELRELVAAADPDVVVTHCPSILPDLKYAAREAIPVVGVVHFECDFRDNDDEHLAADIIITVTDLQRQNLIAAGWPPARSAVIPNVIDVPAEPPSFLRPWRDPPIIGTLARFSEEKGVDLLIEASRILQLRGVPCRTWIGGDGEDEASLAQQVRDAKLDEDVRFCGWIRDKPSFYGAIDVFCLPSRYEAFGIVLLEAAVNAIPIVATACSGALEILANGETGVVVARDSASALADGLASMLGDKRAADRMATRAFATTTVRFDRASVSGRLNVQLEALVTEFRASKAAARPESPAPRSLSF